MFYYLNIMDPKIIPEDSVIPDVINPVIPIVTPVISPKDFEKEVYKLRQEGLGYLVIAKRLNSYPMKIKRICDGFVTKTAEMLHVPLRPVNHVTVQERLKELAPECVEGINNLRSDKSSDIKLRASQDLLNRAGYVPVQKTANLHIVEELSSSEVRSMLRSMLVDRGLLHSIDTDNTTQSISTT